MDFKSRTFAVESPHVREVLRSERVADLCTQIKVKFAFARVKKESFFKQTIFVISIDEEHFLTRTKAFFYRTAII